jgi:hypothetical protein
LLLRRAQEGRLLAHLQRRQNRHLGFTHLARLRQPAHTRKGASAARHDDTPTVWPTRNSPDQSVACPLCGRWCCQRLPLFSCAEIFWSKWAKSLKDKTQQPRGRPRKTNKFYNFHKSSGRPGDKLEVRSACLPPAAGVPPRPPKRVSKLESLDDPPMAESRLYSAGLGAKARPWCLANRPWCRQARPRNTRESVVGHFCGRESNCQILCRSVELLVSSFLV